MLPRRSSCLLSSVRSFKLNQMITIWKFRLLLEETEITVPKGAKILTLQMQLGTPCIWLTVDTKQEKEVRKFITFGTGHSIETLDNLQFIGSYQVSEVLIFHVFEKVNI